MADPQGSAPPAGPQQLECSGSKHRLSQLRPSLRRLARQVSTTDAEIEVWQVRSHLQAVSF